MASYTIALNISNLRHAGVKFNVRDESFLSFWLPAVVMAIYGIIVAVLLFGLTAYHACLALKNQTTSEDLRDRYETWGGNPYSYGDYSLKNLAYFWNGQESLVYGPNAGELHVSAARSAPSAVAAAVQTRPKHSALAAFYQSNKIYNQHVVDTALLMSMEIDDDL